MVSVFNEVLDKSWYKKDLATREKDTQQNMEWLFESMETVSSSFFNKKKNVKLTLDIAEKSELTRKLELGSMYMFKYDPKMKATLPYYDIFPLVVVVNVGPGMKMSGINLHYLPLYERAALLSALLNLATDKEINEKTRLALSYDILNSASRFRLFKPCYKQYLLNHITSQLLYINPKDWQKALFLPTESFQKKTKAFVMKESLRILNKYR